MGYDWFYFLKKAFALYPGVIRPVSAPVFAAHYQQRRAERGWMREGVDLVAGLAFLAWVPWRARRVQRRLGLDAGWRRRAVAIARAGFADPNDIALFRIEAADALGGYIRRFEDAAINKRINPAGWRPGCALADKRLFAERCRAHALPHPPTIAIVTGDAVELVADPAGRALVAKPVDGEGGSGVRRIGAFADGDDLAAQLPQLLGRARGAQLVQPLIAVHPSLAYLALNALPTVRIVTMLDEAGAPEVVSATFRCPSDPAACIDNMKAGGLIAPVDLAGGTLGIACQGYGGGDHAVHPVTGAAIAGRPLPDWAAATALTQQAHATAFADYVLIGWDVALSDKGPILIEGNGKPGVLMPQRAARAGLASGRYGALLAHHLAIKR